MKRIYSMILILSMLISAAVYPVSAAGTRLLGEDFNDADIGASISELENWILRKNTGVTAVVEQEGANKYLKMSRTSNANGALRWDFSSVVSDKNIYTVSYKIMIPQDSFANANTNISVSATEAGSNGPCISITGNGGIKYFTGSGSTQKTAATVKADTWNTVRIIVNQQEKRAKLYVNDEYVDELSARNTSEQLTMLSVFMSNKVQALNLDEFLVEEGEMLPGNAETFELPIYQDFESLAENVSINNAPLWSLRSNTGVTGVVGTDGSNKYLTLSRTGSANAALLWDFSEYVKNEDVYTLTYKFRIPEAENETASANVSVSDAYAVSTGPCINIAAATGVQYFTGEESEMLSALNKLEDDWTEVRMVIYKNEKRARLYVGGKYIDDITARDSSVSLTKLSVFSSTVTNSIMFDDFGIESGVVIPESVEDLIADAEIVFTDAEGEFIDAVPYSGEINAELTVNNPLDETRDISVILALYDEDNALKLASLKYDTVKAEQTTKITVSGVDNDMVKCRAKVFVWFDNMTPARNVVELKGRQLVQMPSVFDDNAVLQRDEPLNIWGEAVPGSNVTVELDSKIYNAKTSADGSWSLTADAISADKNPYTMKVTTDLGGEITYTNILAGDVWLCAGQSNMEWALRRVDGADDEIKGAQYPNIRLYNQSKNGTEKVLKDTADGKWEICTPETAASFSAVGYLFGKELHSDLDVPVGMISAAFGGSRMEAFVSHEALAASSLAHRCSYVSVSDTRRSASRIYNAMIAPIIPYTLKGCIWYQGCSNIGVYDEYCELSKIMLNDWRNRWGDEDMPFIITQLAAYGREGVENVENYPFIREAQLKFAEDEAQNNVGMAVIYESGEKDNIHPTDKYTPAHRLALVAKGMVYGMEEEYMYPSPVSYEVKGQTITVHFENVYKGLECRGETLDSFEIMDADGNWYPASAQIEGGNTVIATDCEHEPVAVRCGFAPYAEPMVNLYNSAGLLVTPFRIGKYE